MLSDRAIGGMLIHAYELMNSGFAAGKKAVTADDIVCNPNRRAEFLKLVGEMSVDLIPEEKALRRLLGLRKAGALPAYGRAKLKSGNAE